MVEGLKKAVTLDRKRGKKQPLYQQVCSEVSKLIAGQNLQGGYSLPSISALAKMLKINYRTAKLAYEMLAKEDVVTYIPNKGAVVKNNKPAETSKQIHITYIRPKINSVWVEISSGIERFCTENNIEFSIVDAGGSHEVYLNALQNPIKPEEGLLVVPYELPQYKEVIGGRINKGVRIVFIDRELLGIEASSVSADHFVGVYNATMHLLQTHKRPVYYFGQSKSPSSSRNWFEAWKTAMNEYGYHSVDSYVYNLHAEEATLVTHKWHAIEDAAAAAMEFLKSVKEKPFSVFVGGDHIAKGIYLAAREIEMQIGRDIFIVGYGNIPMSERFDVPLSSVDQNSELVGYRSAELLYRQLKGELHKNVQIVCPTKLYVRQSSTGTK
jgi:DNA-binding LacI/PurR family transcriptional regulator